MNYKQINFKIIVLLYILSSPWNSFSQSQNESEISKDGRWYFYWGYNRSYYSKTNLHFNGPNYDFTLYDLEATDRPTEFGWTYINPLTITTPQYNIRLGYFITDRLSISAGMDHMKYVVTQNQWTRISGVINTEASPKYAGNYLNEPIQLTPDLLQFEHTNGYNLATLDFEYLIPIVNLRKQKLKLQWNTGMGGIWVVTKTDVRVLEDGLDNDFHVSGYAFAVKTGPRLEFRNRFFLLSELKGHYSSLPSVLIKNAAPEVGDHNIRSLEVYVAVGFLFGGGNNKLSKKE